MQNISMRFSRVIFYVPKRFYNNNRSAGNFRPRPSFTSGSDSMDSEFRSRSGGGGRFGQRRSGFEFNNMTKINWDSEDIPEIKKNIYVESPNSEARSEQEIEEFRRNHSITVSGNGIPKPIFNLAETGFPHKMMECIVQQNYTSLTPIQSQAIPIALSGRDMVGIAQTGSGKTFSFIGPALQHIKNQPPSNHNGPSVLVLAPTRELTRQIGTVASTFGRPMGVRYVCVYGGADRQPQIQQLQRNVEICIATPGRLIDLMNSGIGFNKCSYLVLDEADRMLDMGFEPQIRQIISRIRPDRQVLMWSATWPKEIQSLARQFLKNYIQINIGSLELSANKDITQVVEVCEEEEKVERLMNFLKNNVDLAKDKILIFADTKLRVSQLATLLNKRGIRSGDIHGDKSQHQRDYALDQFRDGRSNILTATDVAARGLDVDDIKCVVNFDFPNDIESYIHRIGRTGRCGKSGLSYSLFSGQDQRYRSSLVKVLREAGQKIPQELLY